MTSGIKYCCDEDDCDNKFDNFSTLMIHRRTHFVLEEGVADRFVCYHCARTYKHKFNLYTHIKEAHRSDRKEKETQEYRCVPCRRVFGSIHGLRSHNSIDHSNYRVKCKICNKEYKNRMGLWRHAFNHIDGVEPYNCNYCAFNTRTRETIRNHMEKVHFVDYDKSVQGPKISMAEVLGHVMDPVVRPPPKPKPEKKPKHIFLYNESGEAQQIVRKEGKYACPSCDVSFPHRSSLKNHYAKHSEDKFQCELCGAEYKHSGNLTTHMLKKHNIGKN